MPKLPSNGLFQLIKGLDKPEKIYFKRFASPHTIENKNRSILLFDLIAKQDTYDEGKILRSGKFNKKSFAVLKQYLYDMVLKSLEAYHSSIESNLQSMIHRIQILNEKNLHYQALHIIKRAKKDAYRYEEYNYLSQIIRKEYDLMNTTHFKKNSKNDLENLFQEERTMVEKHRNAVLYRKVLYEFLFLYSKIGTSRTSSETLIFKKLEQEIISMPDAIGLNFSEKIYLYNIKVSVYDQTGEYSKAHDYSIKIVDLMETTPGRLKAFPLNYLKALWVQLLLMDKFNYKEHIEIAEKIKNIKTKSITIKNEISYISDLSYISAYSETGQYEKAIPLAENFSQEIQHNDLKLNALTGMNISAFFCLFNFYFALKDHSKAKYFLNRVITINTDVRIDYICMAKIISIVLYFEIRDIDLLESATRSTYRFLQKRKKLYKFEGIILNYIRKKMPYANNAKKTIDTFKELKAELEIIFEDKFEARVLKYFDFISWLEAKIEGKDFAEVIRQKGLKLIEG